jgi:hypothetical protein
MGSVYRHFSEENFDPKDPSPWLALYLDSSLPFDEDAKAALLECNDTLSRRLLFPILRPFIFVLFLIIQIIRIPFGRWPNAPKPLHHLIYWGLKTFALPSTNLLILRHFNIGTEVLQFIKDNSPDVDVTTSMPLRPKTLADLKDNVFLQHDLNIYNFIIELNQGLKSQGKTIKAPERVDFSAITDGPFDLEETKKGWLNKIDIQTAIESYTPIYCLFLSRHDFVRASNSLQLDEVISIYLARILDSDYHMSLINNHHPMIPLSTFQAGFRLMMHGYDAEALHGYLRYCKREQQAGKQMA